MNSPILPLFDTIADGLADQGFAVVNDFLSAQEVTAICALDGFKDGLLQFKKAGIGKQSEHHINEAIRGDYIQWIDRERTAAPLHIYLDRLQALIAHLNQALFLSLKDYEVHQTIYPVGAFYKRHLDQFKKDDHRKLSVICYLNENWREDEGGQLRLYLPEGAHDILPLAGRLVCFRSDQLEHEVLPATRPRMSITGWILDQMAGLRHL
jgi:SM-20-related protein